MIVCHLTSAHPREDIRIFKKECISLQQHGFDVSLIVADGKGDDCVENVNIFDVGKNSGRFNRMYTTVNNILEKALRFNADVYHIHDPELLRIVGKLKGKKVIYDVHEDLPRQILAKHWIPSFLRNIVSKTIEVYENNKIKKMNGLVAATPFIKKRLIKLNKNVVNVNNYPILEEFSSTLGNKYIERPNNICYIGALAKIRGIAEIVEAMNYIDQNARLQLGGYFAPEELKDEVSKSKGWRKVNFLGFLNRVQVAETLGDSRIGMVTLHPTINYLDSLPVKMFEYMAAGLPVVASDFPLWKNIIEKNKCGLCVNPLNPKAIGKAIDFLLTNEEQAIQFGQNGRKLVFNQLNWGKEKEKLIHFYKKLEFQNTSKK